MMQVTTIQTRVNGLLTPWYTVAWPEAQRLGRIHLPAWGRVRREANLPADLPASVRFLALLAATFLVVVFVGLAVIAPDLLV
jgi:hypothetical protein